MAKSAGVHFLDLFNAIADALNLPKHLTRMSLHFAVDDVPRVECEVVILDRIDTDGIIHELRKYELRRLPDEAEGSDQGVPEDTGGQVAAESEELADA